MRIRTGTSRQYTNPREQRRLLLLVLLIGGGVILATSFRQWVPQAAQLFRTLREAPSEQAAERGANDGSAIDTRLFPPSLEPSAQPLVSQTESRGLGVPPSNRSPSSADDSVAPQGETAVTASDQKAFTLSDIDFGSVQDDQPFRSAEAGPWFAVLARLSRAEDDAIAAASQGWVTFSELYRRSRDRRGQVVTVKGWVVQAARMKAPKNDAAISEYHQLWVQPADENNPLVVYALSLPRDFPSGNRLEEPVEIHGVFFKRWAYQAHDALRAAPVLLAKGIHWERKPEGDASSAPPAFPVVLLAVLFAAAFVWYVYEKTRPPGRSAKPRASSEEPPSSRSSED
ncbi:MAG: hypothetical protein ACUVTW_09940 [Thermogutta sp.]